MRTKPLLSHARPYGVLRCALVAAAVVTSAAPALAAAAPPAEPGVRYTRPSGKVRARETLDTRFKAAKASQERAAKREVELLRGDAFARPVKAQDIAAEQIEKLRKLLRVTDKSHADYPDLLFRLADHHLEKKAFLEAKSGALYEEIYAHEEKGEQALAARLKARQAGFDAEARAASEAAVTLYRELVTAPQLAGYKRLDEALYAHAFELGRLGREAEMKDAYLRLIRDFPTSPYIPNAYLSFADFYFGQSKIAEAVQLYEKVVTFKDSPVYAYALYKLAWCHLNPVGSADPRYDLSLDYFTRTIDATLAGRAGGEANARQLRRDARRDLVRAFVSAGRPTRAWDFFKRVGDGPDASEDMSKKMMELLAVQYFGQGMYTESTYVYHKLQALFPGDPQGCEWQGRVVINALATDDKQVQWTETARLAEAWQAVKTSDHRDAVKRKCRDETQGTMKQMATVWHDEAEKTRSAATYALAEKAYAAFLAAFPKDRDSYEIQLYYAELLWARASQLALDPKTRAEGLATFRRAHAEFLAVLALDPKGKHTQDAAYAQMLALKNALEYDETGGASKACTTDVEGACVASERRTARRGRAGATAEAAPSYPETPYSADEQAMLAAYDTYQRHVDDPKDPELPKIVYHRARLMVEHNHFDEALPLLERMVTTFDGTVYAAWCSEMLLDVLTIRWQAAASAPEREEKAADALEAWARKLQAMRVYQHPEADRLKEAIPRLLAGIGWRRGTLLLEAGRRGEPEAYRRCAEQFLGVYNAHGDGHAKAATLLWNAAECYEAAYLIGQAVKWRKTLVERYPESEHVQPALARLAGNFQAIAMYDQAAQHMEQYAERYARDAQSPEFLHNAYLFRLGLGQADRASADLTRYEGLYKKADPERAAQIFWSRHAILDADADRIAHAEQYLDLYGKTGGADRRAVAEATIGQLLWRQSCDRGLLHDACMSVRRKRASTNQALAQKADRAQRTIARANARRERRQDIPENCGSPTSGLITVHARDRRKAAEAQRYFDSVLKIAASKPALPEGDAERRGAYDDAVAMAAVYRADQEYEAYLQLEMPTGLSFLVEAWKKGTGVPRLEREYAKQVAQRADSERRFRDYDARKTRLGQSLQKQYDAVVAARQSPYWMLAAAARSALVSQNYADQLYRAPVPKELRTEDEALAYCDALADRARPIEEDALKKFAYCLDRSTSYQFFNEFSRLCEEELQQREPDRYPSTDELFGRSRYTESRPDRVPVLVDPAGPRPAARR